ncbi:hypothetical protein GCM10022406_08540 [Hymenobacter algoricola]|uniref:Uncharacterized protein n=1 Tax=Hymenobacter algoricola TaxID=486267 RepID=A0ABP7MJJ4_9BACT
MRVSAPASISCVGVPEQVQGNRSADLGTRGGLFYYLLQAPGTVRGAGLLALKRECGRAQRLLRPV